MDEFNEFNMGQESPESIIELFHVTLLMQKGHLAKREDSKLE